jgi:hypothetical protein
MASSSSPLTFDTWWDFVPGHTEGATPLINRCIRILGWTEDFAQKALLAYKDFIESKRFSGDYDAIKPSLSIPVFQIWHQHILDTRNYTRDCEILAGGMLHHNPDSDLDQEARAKRIQSTTNVIRLLTSDEELDPEIWSFGSVDQKSERKKTSRGSRQGIQKKLKEPSGQERRNVTLMRMRRRKSLTPHPPTRLPAGRQGKSFELQ